MRVLAAAPRVLTTALVICGTCAAPPVCHVPRGFRRVQVGFPLRMIALNLGDERGEFVIHNPVITWKSGAWLWGARGCATAVLVTPGVRVSYHVRELPQMRRSPCMTTAWCVALVVAGHNGSYQRQRATRYLAPTVTCSLPRPFTRARCLAVLPRPPRPRAAAQVHHCHVRMCMCVCHASATVWVGCCGACRVRWSWRHTALAQLCATVTA